jgi:hypothetical protein
MGGTYSLNERDTTSFPQLFLFITKVYATYYKTALEEGSSDKFIYFKMINRLSQQMPDSYQCIRNDRT